MRPERPPEPGTALAASRAALARRLAGTRERLQALAAGAALPPIDAAPGSGLEILARMFDLSAADVEILALCAAAELDAESAELVQRLTGQPEPVPALAERLVPEAWDALCPEAPLRHWRLIDLGGGGALRARPLRLDERILQFLLGTTYLDRRLEGLIVPVTEAEEGEGLEALIAAWSGAGPLPVLALAGPDPAAKRRRCAAAAARLGRRLLHLRAADIPPDPAQRAALAVLAERELALSGAALLIEAGEGEGAAASRFADLMLGPVILSAPDPVLTERGPRLRIDISPPGRDARRALWLAALGPGAGLTGPETDRLAEQFALDASGIDSAAALARGTGQAGLAPVWQAARSQARRALDSLAERLETSAVWADLVLAPEPLAILHDLEHHLRQAWTVNRSWGWAARSPRGLGTAALFAGASGTGKTLAAEVLANALSLDLFRIDLSQVVSKYIGETEKNLSRIFAAAEDGGAILLFDEADALFGKRSEVKDSHDRYANVEVSYLLQRMESYRGLAILTTNQKAAVDQAFLRRLRYVVTFAFPDAEARARIWAGIFPPETPVEGLDPARLSRLNLTGGSIRSIALNAAFLAAGAGEPVRMAHLARAAQREYAKLEKPFTGSEMGAFR
ncbi:MAG: ATP-binding protein [Sedimentitalea sp.]|nr:ATP-binding protein [Sedimentitalea sp.]